MNNDSTKQIQMGAMISYLSLGINIIISMIYTPWMVKIIGQSNYALYTLATSFISLFLVDFGLSSTVSRFVAKYKAENRNDEIDKFISVVEKLYLIIDTAIIVILTILYFCLSLIYKGLTPEELLLYKQLYIIVAIYSIISFPFLPLSGILNAYERFIQLKLCELLQRIVTVTLTIVALLIGLNVTAIVCVNAFSGILTIMAKLLIIHKSASIKISFRKIDYNILKNVASFSIWTMIMSIAQRCVFNLAPTILGIVSTSTEIAIFSPANALEGYFYTIAAAVNGLFLATVSRYIANNEEEKIFSLMITVGKYQLVVMGVIYVGFACIGNTFMIQWMGVDYLKVWPCALIMFLPDLLIFTQQIANTTLMAKNKIKYQALGYVGMAIVCLSLSLVLSKKMGVIGASISIAVSYLVLYVYMNILYHKVLKFDMLEFYRKCYGSLIVPILISLIICYWLCNYCISISGWIGLLIKGTCIIIIYSVLIWFTLKKNDKELIGKIMKYKKE